MKITLTPEASESLNELIGKLRAGNELVGKNASAVVSKVVVAFNASVSSTELAEIAEGLLSPRARQRALLRKLEALTLGANEELALRVLKKSVRKLDVSDRRLSDNSSESSLSDAKSEG